MYDGEQTLQWEIEESKDYPGHWHVEAIDHDGRVFVAVFSGPEAKERAVEYLDWKNGNRRQATLLRMVSR